MARNGGARIHWDVFTEGATTGDNFAKLCKILKLDIYSVVGRFAKWIIYRTRNKFDSIGPESIEQSPVKVTKAFLDNHVDCEGFTAALIKLGWLERHESGFLLASKFARERYAKSWADAHKPKTPPPAPLTPEQRAAKQAAKKAKRAVKKVPKTTTDQGTPLGRFRT